MAPTVGSQGGGDGTQMARVGPGGLALLPWTKHMLAVLWGQLRLLLQVIYYTFMSGERRHVRAPLFRSDMTGKVDKGLWSVILFEDVLDKRHVSFHLGFGVLML